MKTFKDLEFKQHRSGQGIAAEMRFDNGNILSVVAGSSFYSNPREDKNDVDLFDSFEVAVLRPDVVGWNDFVTKEFVPNANDDVLGWQSRGDINTLMLLIQSQK